MMGKKILQVEGGKTHEGPDLCSDWFHFFTDQI